MDLSGGETRQQRAGARHDREDGQPRRAASQAGDVRGNVTHEREERRQRSESHCRSLAEGPPRGSEAAFLRGCIDHFPQDP